MIESHGNPPIGYNSLVHVETIRRKLSVPYSLLACGVKDVKNAASRGEILSNNFQTHQQPPYGQERDRDGKKRKTHSISFVLAGMHQRHVFGIFFAPVVDVFLVKKEESKKLLFTLLRKDDCPHRKRRSLILRLSANVDNASVSKTKNISSTSDIPSERLHTVIHVGLRGIKIIRDRGRNERCLKFPKI